MTLRQSLGTMLAATAILVATGCADVGPPPDPPAASASKRAFRDLNGLMWFYTTENDTRFSDLERRLDELRDDGIRILGIYSPYYGAKKQWLGAAPRDFYEVPRQNGTVEDFVRLVEAAHERDMKIVAFMGFHSIDEDSDFFRQAERAYRRGDRSSRAVSAFRWTDDPKSPLPTLAPSGPSKWKRSDPAGAWYWSLWDNAAIDASLPGGAAEIDRAISFWMELGLDGYMLDSGVPKPGFEALWVGVPERYKKDVWLTFESTHAEAAKTYEAFGLTSWFALEDNDYANTYSLVVMPEKGARAIDADGLERQLGGVAEARAHGRLTHGWSLLERAYPDDRMRIQEAALMAGAGILYGAADYDDAYLGWPASVRAEWNRVLATMNAHPALYPSATRTRLASGADPLGYAMRSTAGDGSEAAILAFNFHDAPAKLTIAVPGLAGRVATQNLHDHAAPAIVDGQLTLDLPAYGFAILGIDRR